MNSRFFRFSHFRDWPNGQTLNYISTTEIECITKVSAVNQLVLFFFKQFRLLFPFFASFILTLWLCTYFPFLFPEELKINFVFPEVINSSKVDLILDSSLPFNYLFKEYVKTHLLIYSLPVFGTNQIFKSRS